MAQTTTINDYDALTTGAALLERPEAGLLLLTDADRSDFLQRMTTNEINRLAPGMAAVTVLTSPTARILFAFTVLARPDVLWLLPVQGQAAALERHLRGQIFFMDKVKVHNTTDQYRRCRLLGPLAEQVLTNVGFAATTLADDRWLEQEQCVILKQTKFEAPGFEVIAPQEIYASTVAKFADAGAVLLSNEDAYQSYRIELGRPLAGHELTDAYNPLEVGLAWACADNKGCYTGQEIIARQVTYDKVTKSLVGLRSDTVLPVGAEVMDESRVVGAVTSTVVSKELDGPLALAVVKRPQNTPGTVVTVNDQRTEVVALPVLEVTL